MNTPTPRKRAEVLLNIHGGSCFISHGCDLETAFREMEKEGLVVITESQGLGCKGIDVKSKDFTPGKLTPDEEEPQTY